MLPRWKNLVPTCFLTTFDWIKHVFKSRKFQVLSIIQVRTAQRKRHFINKQVKIQPRTLFYREKKSRRRTTPTFHPTLHDLYQFYKKKQVQSVMYVKNQLEK